MILTPHEILTIFAAGGAFGVLCGLVIGYAWGLFAGRPRHGRRGGAELNRDAVRNRTGPRLPAR
jgi:hypothetical protein